MTADAQLVGAAVGGGAAAFVPIYDRYCDRIHDYARSVLRSDADASDVTQDTFLTAAERLHQLRDPSRLRPWLYAIARSHAFRLLRARQRVEVSNDVDEVAVSPMLDGALDAASLITVAVDGLEADDRDLLDLHLRQGLEGHELAAALGVDRMAANTRLHRVRDRLEQAVGAALLIRSGRTECADLGRIAPGRLTPLNRKRINRHANDCSVCGRRRSEMTDPDRLFAAMPVAVAPRFLRDEVIGRVAESSFLSAGDPVMVGGDAASHGSRGAPAARVPRSARLTGGGSAWQPVVAAVMLAATLGGAFAMLRSADPNSTTRAALNFGVAPVTQSSTTVSSTLAPTTLASTGPPVPPQLEAAVVADTQPTAGSQATTPATTTITTPSTVAPETSTASPTPTTSTTTSTTVAPSPPVVTIVSSACTGYPNAIVDVMVDGVATFDVDVEIAWATTGISGANEMKPVAGVAGRHSGNAVVPFEATYTIIVWATSLGGSTSTFIDTCTVVF